MNKELQTIKNQIDEILERDNCHTQLIYKDGYDTYKAESVEELQKGVIAVLLKSKVQTKIIRRNFKPSTPCYSVPKHTEEQIYALLSRYGYEETKSISSGCYYQVVFRKVKD